MLLNYSLLIAFAFIAAILTIVIFVFLFRKRNKGAGFLLGLIAGGGLAAFIILYNNSTVYIVHGNDDYSTFAAYGTSVYKMYGGEEIQVHAHDQKLLIINDSEVNLVLEKVVYGSFAFASTFDISAGNTHAAEISKIDYFFDDTPPESLKSNEKRIEQFWLRLRRE